MRPNKYPDDSSYASGEVVTTKPIHQLTSDVTAGDYMYPYYMGYYNYDDTPAHALCTRVSLTADKDILFEEEAPRNHAWGFCTCTASAGVPWLYMGYVDSGGTIQRVYYGLTAGTSRFINKACMARYAVTNTITLHMSYIVVPKVDLDSNDSAAKIRDYTNNVYVSHCYNGAAMLDVTIPFISTDSFGNGFDNFYTNESPINFGDINIAGQTINISLLASDFPDDNPTARKEFTVNGTDYVFFGQLTYYDYNYYGRYRKAADEASTAVSIVPFIEHDGFELSPLVTKPGTKWITIGPPTDFRTALQLNIDYYYGETADSVSVVAGSVINTGICMGKFYVKNGIMQHGSGTDCYWWCAQTATIPGLNRDGILQGRHICYSTNAGDNVFNIYPMLRPKDIWYAIFPLHKLDTAHNTQSGTNPQNSYTATYSTSIFDSNVPTDTRKRDTTANLTPELMNWQLPSADITVNEFDIDEMPSYEPTVDTLGKFIGDSIYFTNGDFGNTGNFITNWVLTADQISAFGAKIWTDLLDFDPQGDPLSGIWENIRIAKQSYWNTGSLDPASLLDLVISLRYYPMNLELVSSNIGCDENVYFGTGKVGVDVDVAPATVRKLDTLCTRIGWMENGVMKYDCKIKVPTDADKVYFDWRDFVDATASLYIPFCGTYQIPIAEIVPGDTLVIRFIVDMTSGALTANVHSEHDGAQYPILIATGQCGFEVPITATNANRLTAAVIGDYQSAIGAIVEPIQGVTNDVMSAMAMTSGGGLGGEVAGGSGGSYEGDILNTAASGQNIISINADAVMTPINIGKGMLTRPAVGIPLLQGARGWAALSCPQYPYLQIRKGRYVYPSSYTSHIGRPEFVTRKISSVKGYAEAVNVNASGLSCTLEERQMIKQILETGFYRK